VRQLTLIIERGVGIQALIGKEGNVRIVKQIFQRNAAPF
jgi:hypothetical protein